MSLHSQQDAIDLFDQECAKQVDGLGGSDT